MKELLSFFRRGHLWSLGKLAPTIAQRTRLEDPRPGVLQGMVSPAWGLRAGSEVRSWQSPLGFYLLCS